MAAPPKLRSDLISSPSVVDGVTVFTVKDPIGGKYFRLREPEHWLIHQFDGQSTPDEIATRFGEKFGLQISGSDVTQFAAALDNLFFLENTRSEQILSRTGTRTEARRPLWQRILYLRLKAFKPGKGLDWLTRLYGPFHRPFWFVVQGLVILAGLIVLFANLPSFEVSLSALWNLGSIGLLILSMFILVTLHEFAHAVTCRVYGGEVREIGFLLLYFQPCFYCDLSDAWLFPKKSQRLAVSFAGPFFQLVLLAVSVIVWRLAVPGVFVSQLAWMLVTVNWINFLFNFNPLIKLDGYYLLSDWLEIPNLRQKAFSYLGNALKRRLLGWPIESIAVTARQRRIFVTYGMTALIYSVLLLGYMFTLVAEFLMVEIGPAGPALLVLVILFILRSRLRNLAQGIISHVKFMKRLLKQPLKLAGYLIVVAVILVIGLALPLPHRVSGEVLVRPVAMFTVRLNEYGVLEKISRRGGDIPTTKTDILQLATTDMAALQVVPLVRDGESVTAGDTIAAVTSNQITRDIKAGKAELERLQNELALLKALPKKQAMDEAKASIKSAKATLTQNKRERDRMKSLVDSKLEARERLESIQAQVEVAEAEVARCQSALNLLQAPPRPEEEDVVRSQIQKQQAQLDFLVQQAAASRIESPISGVVRVAGKNGAVVEVATCDPVELLLPVSDFDLPLVTLGQTVQVKVRSFPNQVFSGTVVRIPRTSGTSDAQAGGVFQISVLVANPDGLLRDGMSGYAKIEAGKISAFSWAFRKVYQNLRVEFWSWW